MYKRYHTDIDKQDLLAKWRKPLGLDLALFCVELNLGVVSYLSYPV